MPVVNGKLVQTAEAYQHVYRLCSYLAETPNSCTQGYPGIYVAQYTTGWVGGDLDFPADLLHQPEMAEHRHIFDGKTVVYGVPFETTILCTVRLGYLVEGERGQILAMLTLELMGSD